MSLVNPDALTAVDIAEALGVTKQTVYNWLKNDGLPCSEAGKAKVVKLADLIEWYGNRQPTKTVKSVKLDQPDSPVKSTETYEEALMRRTRAEADLKELQLAEKRAQVASIELVEKVLGASNVAVRTQIEALPSLLATQLVGIPDQGTVQRLVAVETKQLLTNLASIDAIREAAHGVEVEE